MNAEKVGRRLRSLIAVAVVVGLLGACSTDDAATPATAAAPDATSTTVGAISTSTSEATTTTAAEPAADIVLRGDGLGVTTLGAAPDPAVAAVTAALGEPTEDTGWQPSFSVYGTCPGEQIRGVEWEHLVLLFTDGETSYGRGQHLFSWRISGSPPALGTATGFGYRATAADAEELYPGAVEVVPADDPFPAFLQIAAEGGPITAYLNRADVVTNLEAGAACGE